MLTNLFYIINFSVAIIVSVVALIFGFLTIIIVIIKRQCRTINNLLTCNTATVVILYYILNLSSAIYGLRDDWSYNQPACVFRAYCLNVLCTAICYSFLIQGISRLFFTVFYKYKFLLTWRVHWLMIVVNWLISIIAPIMPLFFVGSYGLEQESHLCISTTKIFITSMYSVGTAYLIPFNTMGVIYGTIFYYARQSTRRVIPFPSATSTARTIPRIPTINVRREIKLMKNMLTLMGLLACGGMPFFVLVLWHVIQHQAPESFYLLAFNSISLFTALLMITMFSMSKEVKKCAVDYLLKLC